MPARKLLERKTSSNIASLGHTPTPSDVTGPADSIRTMFDGIAGDYDRFNQWSSLGLHGRWRLALAAHVPAQARVLDLACGTGDVAFLLASRGHSVTGLDVSESMLNQARRKDPQRKIQWLSGSADHLPFSDAAFGAVTSAFALRNIRHCLDQAFRENFRVLESGGKVLHMDFGRPAWAPMRWGHRLYMHYAIPAIGRWICGGRWPDSYLESTIEQFYEPADVETRLKSAGFIDVTHRPLLFGVVQLYAGTKP